MNNKTGACPIVLTNKNLTTMKKNFFGKVTGVLLLAVMALVCSCNGCKGETPKIDDPVVVYHDYDGVVQDFTAGTAQIQALHRQTMYSLIQHLQDEGHTIALNGKYQWRNSRVILNDTVTMENIDDLHVVAVNDVFFYWDSQKGPMVQYINSHVKYGVQIPYPINDVWIEDADMSEQPIKISAEQALMRLKEWNGILPKDCNFLTLRYPVGPKDCNVQWVFGDVYDVLFIDAVTGEIRDYDPAFSRQ